MNKPQFYFLKDKFSNGCINISPSNLLEEDPLDFVVEEGLGNKECLLLRTTGLNPVFVMEQKICEFILNSNFTGIEFEEVRIRLDNSNFLNGKYYKPLISGKITGPCDWRKSDVVTNEFNREFYKGMHFDYGTWSGDDFFHQYINNSAVESQVFITERVLSIFKNFKIKNFEPINFMEFTINKEYIVDLF